VSRRVELRCVRVRVPLRRAFVTARRAVDALEATLVAADVDGVRGWGEAATTWRVTGESAESVAAAVAGPLQDAVAHVDPLDGRAVEHALAEAVIGNASARSAVACAVADAAAQQRGLPLARALGAAALQVRTDLTVSAGPLDDMVAGARDAARTTGAVKLKLGRGDDSAVLPAVRDAIGEGPLLRVDVNQGWTAEAAIRAIRSWEDAGCGVDLVEQPVRAGDLVGMSRIRSAVATPILADESVHDADDLDRVVELGAADAVNLKLAKCGGPVAALDLAARARAAGLGVLVGSMLETAVGVAAAAAVAATVAPDAVHDLDAAMWTVAGSGPGGLRYRGGLLELDPSPGLGAVVAEPAA
jgi:L-Ala-D/L-Glu epimerase